MSLADIKAREAGAKRTRRAPVARCGQLQAKRNKAVKALEAIDAKIAESKKDNDSRRREAEKKLDARDKREDEATAKKRAAERKALDTEFGCRPKRGKKKGSKKKESKESASGEAKAPKKAAAKKPSKKGSNKKAAKKAASKQESLGI